MTEFSVIQAIPLIAFCLLLLLQSLLPKRLVDAAQQGSNRVRMLHNLLLFAVNTVLMRVLVPLTLVSASIWAEQNMWGIFHHLNWPLWMVTMVCVVVLDFAIYWQHVATHKIPLLWRMHKVHHADQHMDVTTAVRFHPLELLLSLGFKSLAVILLGAPIIAVVIFELLLFIGPAFNHSNLRLPSRLDRVLRWAIVTPDTHRSHHSIIIKEQNTNYGFFFIWWDKLFGTYTQEPRAGHLEMQLGLESPDDQCQRVDQLLMAPFR